MHQHLRTPSHPYYSLQTILDHLVTVLAHEADTKMTSASLATCFGPTIFTPAEVSDTALACGSPAYHPLPQGDTAMQAYDILSQNAVVKVQREEAGLLVFVFCSISEMLPSPPLSASSSSSTGRRSGWISSRSRPPRSSSASKVCVRMKGCTVLRAQHAHTHTHTHTHTSQT